MSSNARLTGWALLIALIFFGAVAPTLPMLEFSNGAEGLNVATALEIRRTRNWLIPTLQGETRLAKPPLAAWITASAISNRTLLEIRSPDSAVRNPAFRRLAWEVRWPALVAACVILLATFMMMRGFAPAENSLTALAVAGSNLLLLRYCRYATVDIYLAMWVTIANAFLLRAVVQGRWWSGCIGSGVALGFALLTKGPVALVMTVVPVALIAPFCSRSTKPIRWAAIGAAIALMLVIALPWFCHVLGREPRAWGVWISEVSRIDATESKPDRWYSYLAIVPYMAPWSVFLVAGLMAAIARRDDARLMLFTALLLVPLLIMSFFKDRAERYMLPVTGSAAAICAISFCQTVRSPRRLRVMLLTLHWLLLGTIAIGFPLAAGYALNWISPALSISAALASILILGCGLLARHRPVTLVACTFSLMLIMQWIFIAGYRHSQHGKAELRPLAEVIASQFPDAEIYNGHPDGKRPPPELGVYLSRTITWTADPSKIAQGPSPGILLLIQRRGTGEPAPAGWKFVAKYPRDKDWWWAFVRVEG